MCRKFWSSLYPHMISFLQFESYLTFIGIFDIVLSVNITSEQGCTVFVSCAMIDPQVDITLDWLNGFLILDNFYLYSPSLKPADTWSVIGEVLKWFTCNISVLIFATHILNLSYINENSKI